MGFWGPFRTFGRTTMAPLLTANLNKDELAREKCAPSNNIGKGDVFITYKILLRSCLVDFTQ